MSNFAAKLVVEDVFYQYKINDNPEPGDDAPTKAVLMVSYRPFNDKGRSLVTKRWDDLRPTAKAEDPHSAVGQMSKARYEAIKPYVDQFLTGNELPEQGTPLAAWAHMDGRRAEIVKRVGIRTVEELAQASDTTISKIPLPDIKGYRLMANRFLASSEQSKTAAKIGAQEREIDTLRSELDEMRQMFREMTAAKQADLAKQAETEDEDSDRAQLRQMAKERGIHVGNKSTERLMREIEAHDAGEPGKAVA